MSPSECYVARPSHDPKGIEMPSAVGCTVQPRGSLSHPVLTLCQGARGPAMPTPIIYQEKSGAITYRVTGEVSDANVVTLHLSLVDADGQIHGGGDLTLPLARSRTTREVLWRAMQHHVEAVTQVKA